MLVEIKVKKIDKLQLSLQDQVTFNDSYSLELLYHLIFPRQRSLSYRKAMDWFLWFLYNRDLYHEVNSGLLRNFQNFTNI